MTEHQRSPQGQHSEALQRLLIYFRGRPQVDKYAIACVEVNKVYRIVALSGHRGVPPRLVEDKIYTDSKRRFPRRVRAACAGSARVVNRLRGAAAPNGRDPVGQ